MGMTVTGVQDLLDDLTGIANRVAEDGPASRRILRSAAQPVHRQMKANASSDPKRITKALWESIKVGTIRKRGSNRSITIGVHHSENDAYYANPVEFGHGGPAPAPAHPFVRPAFDATADEAYGIIRDGLRDAIGRS